MKKVLFICMAVLSCCYACMNKHDRQKQNPRNTLHCRIEGIYVSPQDKMGRYNIMLSLRISNETGDTIFLPPTPPILYDGVPFFQQSVLEGKYMGRTIPFLTTINTRFFPRMEIPRDLYGFNIVISDDKGIHADSLKRMTLELRKIPHHGSHVLERVVFHPSENTGVYILPAGLNNFTAYKALGTKRFFKRNGEPVE